MRLCEVAGLTYALAAYSLFDDFCRTYESEQDHLTQDQVKLLAQLMKDISHG